ncbi:MAG: PIG-L family deacetylase [Candidatus Bipolaricaulota bacterium]|nr:MAG: PIG-L family deacetylase [Candidatus Bipolaricaulota bacterium]
MSSVSRGNILVIAPHPDDETLACGGTIVKRLRAGWPVKVVFVTDGRRAYSALFGIETDPTPEELAAIRRDEAHAAAAVLGLGHDDLAFLGIAEGALEGAPHPILLETVAQAIDDVMPVVELFLPHPLDGHATHRAVHALVTKAVAELALAPVLYHYLIWDEGAGEPLGDPVEIDIADVLEAKRTAIECYRSQIGQLSPQQPCPVLNAAFLAPFRGSPTETFWR